MMAITARQRAKLPRSAFALPKQRKYPVPTKAQARKAGISEAQRIRLGRNALTRANQRKTTGSYRTIATVARRRMGGKIGTVSRGRGTVSSPGYARGRRR
jgi:hypothetical protein